MVFPFTERRKYHYFIHAKENNNNQRGAIQICHGKNGTIKKFPYVSTLSRLNKYKELIIGRNIKIKQMTKDIEKFNKFKIFEINTDVTKIKHFKVPDNNLLEKLILNNNKNSAGDISEILKQIAKNSPKLKELVINNYKLPNIPKEIFELKNLKELIIRDCKLEKLDGDISKLTNLTRLDLYGNKLEELPETISHLKNLEELNVSKNNLKTLPKSINKLKNLRLIKMLYPTKGFHNSIKNMKVEFLEFHLYKTHSSGVNVYKNTKNLYNKFPMPKPLVINSRTQIINSSFMANNNINSIPPNRRAFIKKKGERYNNGTLRRLYDYNALMRYMSPRGNGNGRLGGETFKKSDIKLLKNVNHIIKNKSPSSIRNKQL